MMKRKACTTVAAARQVSAFTTTLGHSTTALLVKRCLVMMMMRAMAMRSMINYDHIYCNPCFDHHANDDIIISADAVADPIHCSPQSFCACLAACK